MAYTQSALQTELSKQREASIGWPWRLMTLSLIVLLTVIAVYVGMKFGFQDAYLQSQLDEATAESAAVFKSVTPDEQKQIFSFYSQLSNIDTLLDKQAKASPYLDLLDKNTLKSVTYNNIGIAFSAKTAVIDLDGRAASYGVVVQQMDLYKDMPSVTDVKLQSARVAGQASDGVVFVLQVTVNR